MIAAYLCLILPGSLVMIALGATYEFYRNEPTVRGALQVLQGAATALILYSATRLNLSRWSPADYLLALATCLAMFSLKAPLWMVLPLGALLSLACAAGGDDCDRRDPTVSGHLCRRRPLFRRPGGRTLLLAKQPGQPTSPHYPGRFCPNLLLWRWPLQVPTPFFSACWAIVWPE